MDTNTKGTAPFAEVRTAMVDIYGRVWPGDYELCPACGQPDNCGDCTHGRLSDEDALYLGALGMVIC